MQVGLTIANHGEYADPAFLVEAAVEAERAGWDGVFVWDHVARTGQPPMTDPWVALSAIAAATQTVRLGPMVTPLPRRRPWKVAREVVSLDHLSGGRVTLGVGLGVHAIEFDAVGEETDLRRRAGMLDEALELLRLLWTGQPVTFEGAHYTVEGLVHQPVPVQAHIPIWVAGVWPNRKPMERAARHDGAFPITDGGMKPQDIRDVLTFITPLRDGDGAFDLVHEASTEPGESLVAHAGAGVTWWLEQCRPEDRSRDEALARIQAGPTRP